MTMTLEEFSGPREMTQLELSDSMELSVSRWTLVVLKGVICRHLQLVHLMVKV